MANSDISTQLVVGVAVPLILGLIMKNVKPVPKVREDGKKVLRYGVGYEIMLWAGGILSGVGGFGSFTVNEARLGVGLIVMSLIFLGGGVYFRRYAIVYDGGGDIEYYPGFGAPFTFTWGDLTEARYSAQMQGWILTLQTGHKVTVYTMLNGAKDFIATARAHTRVPIPDAPPTSWF